MPKRKTYFTCKSCKSKHIKPIDEQCPFNVNIVENDIVSVVDNIDNVIDSVDNVDSTDHNVQDFNQTSITTDLGLQILSAVMTFDSRLTAMERRVQTNVNPLTCDPHQWCYCQHVCAFGQPFQSGSGSSTAIPKRLTSLCPVTV